tara:strand:- start:116 stop:544 length:429 start_codon:yes stop_codon:yes gene_type:complete
VTRKLSLSRVIKEDNEKVFKQIANFENYSEFIPGCSNAKLIEKNNEYEIGELSFNFFLKTYLLRSKNILTENTIKIEQIKGPFNFFIGQWSVNQNETSLTDVYFDAEFKLPLILEKITTDDVIESFCDNAFEAFIERLQAKN